MFEFLQGYDAVISSNTFDPGVDGGRLAVGIPVIGLLRVDPKDLAATGVQVLNAKAIGIRFAEMCVALKLTQSALTYPRVQLSAADFTA
jgi:hypothetical protein